MSLPETILPPLARALAEKGYSTLTDVQSAILDAGSGRDLLVSAQTGSGKTVAFGMAIAPTILGEDHETFPDADAPLALVIAPTRELALQVRRELDWLYAQADVRTASAVGGMDARAERRALERGAHIVVGTPGRLRDHITRGALDMSALRAVVLDEADEMLDLGFREDLEFILAAAPEERRTLLFSATVPRAIAELAKTFQRNAERISVSAATDQHADIDYKLMLVPAAEREHAVINTLLWFDAVNTIVFASTREAVKHLSARLHNRGFDVVTLSGELTQAERTNALQAMRDGRARICVATDVAARGIDLPNLDLVIHAELPTNPDTLLHRSGRTGRAGRKGTCVLIAPTHRRAAAHRLLRAAKLEVGMMPPPSAADIDARYNDTILSSDLLTAPVTDEEADLVAALVARHAPGAIAAAYLRLQQAARPVPEDVSAPEPDAPREKRTRKDFEGGTWFKVTLGRKHKAEPRWLLPMLCKAGGVTKGAIGSIRIFDTETLFEVVADKVDAFTRNVERNGSGERGVSIMPTEGAGEAPARKPRKEGFDPAFSKPPRKPKHGSGGLSAADFANPAAKPPGKDKGKPKWSKPAPDGARPDKTRSLKKDHKPKRRVED